MNPKEDSVDNYPISLPAGDVRSMGLQIAVTFSNTRSARVNCRKGASAGTVRIGESTRITATRVCDVSNVEVP